MLNILETLRTLYEERGEAIETWLAAEREAALPFVYTSVDLRHAGHRIVPVDTNLFPAGFNNLSPAALGRAARYFSQYFAEYYPHVNKVLVIPENHTRNLAYIQNLWCLAKALDQSGVEVRIGSLTAEIGKPLTLLSSEDKEVTQYGMVRDGARVIADGGFVPDLVLMNNDMTAGVPELIRGISQPVIPPPEMGWWRRRKSEHFCAYQKLATSFSEAFGLDRWLIHAEFHQCGVVDFKERTGLDCVAKGVDKVLARAREKHKEYGITEDPYVYVKADSGTYGMGIMTVKSGSEILEINKKERNKMHVIKEGARVSEVIIQEGVATIDTVDGKPAEPMIYMVDGLPAGGMYRVNGARDAYNNLNASGMEFTGMCDEMEPAPGKQRIEACHFRSFGLVAALAALSTARERYEPRQRCAQ